MERKRQRLLVIDDEPQIRRFLGISLGAQGYDVVEAATGRQGLEFVQSHAPDLVILDLGLPDIDGQLLLREIRRQSALPVLVLSVRSSESEKVMALDAGANDYVSKPFGVQELSARLRALLRPKAPSDTPTVFDDGHLQLDAELRVATLDGVPLVLGKKEWALLATLAGQAGRVVSQSQLLRDLWGPTHVDDTHYLRILVAKLRLKLGDDATAPRYIQTEPGVGLRFIG